MKILNVDSIAAPKKFVNIKGERYQVKEMTVADFIEVAQAAENFDDENATLLDRFEVSMRAVKRALPDIKDEVLRSLTVDQMGVVNRFLRDDLMDKDKDAVEEVEGK